MASVSQIFIFTLQLVFLNEIALSLARDECSSNSDCPSNFLTRVCCAGLFYDSGRSCWYHSCVGRYCSTDGDCGGVGECCNSNQCVTFGCEECSSNFDCDTSEYCCKHRYIDDHNVCRRSCVGETCHSNSDCGGPGERCNSNNKCEEYNITVLSWSIPVLVVGLLLFAIVVGGVFVYRYFQKPSRRGTVQPVRPAERTTAIIALQETQMHSSSSAPAYNCPPPPYFNQGQGLPPQPKHFVSS